MKVHEYLTKLSSRFKTGISTEHSYRGDLQSFLESLIPEALITNEPKRIECGAPDYIITKDGIPLGYIEAKDLGADLTNSAFDEQFDRYRASLPNLIITNYLDFWYFIDGELVMQVSLGTTNGNRILENDPGFPRFTSLIDSFSTWKGQTITSSRKLAEMMAAKARLLATVIDNVLTQEEQEDESFLVKEENLSLFEQLSTFKNYLIHDLTHKQFADIYAQTIAYGMFAARLNDPTPQTFTRQEAADLIPRTNPFLRRLFQYIAGYDLDSRIVWIVDALAGIFRATDVSKLLENFGTATQRNDPIVHFYETFLSEYDPALRKARGVWYTPEPVVHFIVRGVDDILKAHFSLKDGLGDNSKTTIQIKVANKKTSDRKSKIQIVDEKVSVHKVQILDPACGTGTFLAEIIKHLYKKFEANKGIWSSYVENDLIPRLNGFEILMASYTMAHLKLDLLLSETGYRSKSDQRFKIFLTNSLEEFHPATGTIFASWLSDEANQANRIKRDTPVMVVTGNPPYSISSSNRGQWIVDLIKDYKAGLHEKKLNLDDDYIKFIRHAEYYIAKNGQGIVAMITNNSYLKGPTHRQMRKHLLETFNYVYTIDLHGDSNKKETTPDGKRDQNVFDIMQGVSICFFVKVESKNEKRVLTADIWGAREEKYQNLWKHSLASIDWVEVKPTEPYYFFKEVNHSERGRYEEGVKVSELFPLWNSGLTTDRDELFTDIDEQPLRSRIRTLLSGEMTPAFKERYKVRDSGSYKIMAKIKDKRYKSEKVTQFLYRPFDIRFIYYDEKVVSRPGFEVMKHFIGISNLGLIIPRQATEDSGALVTNKIIGHKTFSAYNRNSLFPLMLKSEGSALHNSDVQLTPNIDQVIAQDIAQSINMRYEHQIQVGQEELGTGMNTSKMFPVDIFDYVYSVLHSSSYKEDFKEFLSLDFPRIPRPLDQETFWSMVRLGRELRLVHLMDYDVTGYGSYPVEGDNEVNTVEFELVHPENVGRVWINESQYFDNVPQHSWDSFIGGYQPAQKWLKDRVGRALSYDDIVHYQKITFALKETGRIMNEIDLINHK